MIQKKFIPGIGTYVAVAMLGLLLLLGGLSWGVIAYHVERMHENMVLNQQIDLEKDRYTRLTNLKLVASEINGHVTSASLEVHEIVEQEDHSASFDFSKRREELWQKEIMPSLIMLESQIERSGFSDNTKKVIASFVADVRTNLALQDKILSDFRAGQLDYDWRSELDHALINRVWTRHDQLLDLEKDFQVGTYKAYDLKKNLPVYLWTLGVLALFLAGVIYRLLVHKLRKPINDLEEYICTLEEGEFPEPIRVKTKEYRPMAASLFSISEGLHQIYGFAKNVGQGHLAGKDENTFKRKGILGNALGDMQESLTRVAKGDSQRQHINEGLAKFSEILGNNGNNLERFGEEVIVNLVKFLNANQGAIFVVNDEEPENEFLELKASYAYDKKKFIQKQIKRGQGLVGQAWLEMEPIYMTKVPEDFVNITSGLGESTPRCVLIIPLKFNDKVQGVIELASFKALQDYELGFVEKVTESISAALSSVKVNDRTQELLKRSEQLATQMRAQEEETRKNVEELRVTQEESQKREERYIREIRRLKKRIQEFEQVF